MNRLKSLEDLKILIDAINDEFPNYYEIKTAIGIIEMLIKDEKESINLGNQSPTNAPIDDEIKNQEIFDKEFVDELENRLDRLPMYLIDKISKRLKIVYKEHHAKVEKQRKLVENRDIAICNKIIDMIDKYHSNLKSVVCLSCVSFNDSLSKCGKGIMCSTFRKNLTRLVSSDVLEAAIKSIDNPLGEFIENNPSICVAVNKYGNWNSEQ